MSGIWTGDHKYESPQTYPLNHGSSSDPIILP